MDVISRIKGLMGEKGWSVYELARRSDLPQSTLSNIFNRRNLPTISTLEQICNTLGITLADFFAAEPERLDTRNMERELLELWHLRSPEQQKCLLDLLRSLS